MEASENLILDWGKKRILVILLDITIIVEVMKGFVYRFGNFHLH
jgi:hypothetical protein